MQIKNRDHKKKWTALVAGWQAQVDRARAEQMQSRPGVENNGNTGMPVRSVTPRRGFLDGHRRPGVYPRFTQKLGTRTPAPASAGATAKVVKGQSDVYLSEVSLPAGWTAAPSKGAVAMNGKLAATDRTQKLYKCPQVALVFKPFCEYLSNTTKKRISPPNTLNSVLHFASVVTLVVAQIVLLGTYFCALAPRARVTRHFFLEIHQPVYQEDAEKMEALISTWQARVQTYSAIYSAGLMTYIFLMASFLGATIAYYWTRRPQDPWWGWLNWAQGGRDAWAFVSGKVGANAQAGTAGRTPISVESFHAHMNDRTPKE